MAPRTPRPSPCPPHSTLHTTVRGAAYALRAARAAAPAAAWQLAWWAMTAAGLGGALCAQAAALVSWYRNAKDASRPAGHKTWARAAQLLLFAGAAFGPVMAVASAGTARGAKTVGAVAAARGVEHASAWVRAPHTSVTPVLCFDVAFAIATRTVKPAATLPQCRPLRR